MQIPLSPMSLRVALALAGGLTTICGCSRTTYRLQADREAYHVVAERNVDPRWSVDDYSIEMDPRSRYYEPCNPDRSPMPPDDPTSHQYMVSVDGMKGWKHWHDNGDRTRLENPGWQDALSKYADTTEDGAVTLDMENALRLAYMHSPSHQNQLETLYLSALDVTAERFRLDTQFFGGYDAVYRHQGSLSPPRLTYNATLGRYVVTPATDGIESNRLTVGRPSAGDPALQARRRFATAGQLLAGFANSFVFDFTGGDADFSASLANFSFIQPLLRGAGKDIALEQLTFAERNLLANLRAYSRFRKGFYTQVAIGELSVTGPQRAARNTRLTSFGGAGGLGGYLGLLQQSQQIRNTVDDLKRRQRILDRLGAFYQNDLIDLMQVDEFQQDIQLIQSGLLQSQNAFELTLDNYKTTTLGLPPDLPVELDEMLIERFQLIPPELSDIVDSVVALQKRAGERPEETPSEAEIRAMLAEAATLVEAVEEQFPDLRKDIARMERAVSAREKPMNETGEHGFDTVREESPEDLVKDLKEDLSALQEDTSTAADELQDIEAGLRADTRAASQRVLIAWVARFLNSTERLVLVPARARVQTITIEPVNLSADDAFGIALANRLDFMNGRAALVDNWRLIQVSADALQSVVDITADGEVRTARNNPLSFRAPTGSLRMGLEFDAPFTRLLERNAYREALIKYQRNRRNFIQSRDALQQGLRALFRELKRLGQDLEIQRRAVTIAIRRVDMMQAELMAPVAPPQPGQRMAVFGSDTSRRLISAQRALRNSQNSLLRVWLTYHATRMRLSRELGTMKLDAEGRWIESPLPTVEPETLPRGDQPDVEELPVPPAIPAYWMTLADQLDAASDRAAKSATSPRGDASRASLVRSTFSTLMPGDSIPTAPTTPTRRKRSIHPRHKGP